MREAITICCVLLVIASTSGTAEIVEVPLPDLIGSYTVNDNNKDAYFQMDRLPTEIHKVEIRLSGTHNVGEVFCEFITGIIEGPDPSPVTLYTSMRDTVNDNLWYAEGFPSEISGEFELTFLFKGYYGQTVTWEFLLSGHSTISFYGRPSVLVPFCWFTIYPDVTIEEATLLIDGEFPIAAEHTTWGKIRSLFK